ncbi:hypothetical protein PTKIN_Ptkin03bG0242600 [Pterospermum kingtungense]
MASGPAKYHVVVVVSGDVNNTSAPFITQQFDLDEAMTMPVNVQARHQTVARLVSDIPVVNPETGRCSICMESFGKSEEAASSRQVSCGHVYHHNCITDWLLSGNSNSCPLCRREISG